MTVKQLQAALKKAKVPYDVKARKAELVELLTNAQAAKVSELHGLLSSAFFFVAKKTRISSLLRCLRSFKIFSWPRA